MQVDFYSAGSGAIIDSVDAHLAHLDNLNVLMTEAEGLVREATKHWMDSEGEGSWPRLSPHTEANRAAQGLEPTRPLYAYGNLYDSATTDHGPYSKSIHVNDGVELNIEWIKDGYNIAEVLSRGTARAGKKDRTKIPPRPIWPPIHSVIGMTLQRELGELFLTGSVMNPAWAGAKIGRGAGGRFVKLGL